MALTTFNAVYIFALWIWIHAISQSFLMPILGASRIIAPSWATSSVCPTKMVIPTFFTTAALNPVASQKMRLRGFLLLYTRSTNNYDALALWFCIEPENTFRSLHVQQETLRMSGLRQRNIRKMFIHRSRTAKTSVWTRGNYQVTWIPLHQILADALTKTSPTNTLNVLMDENMLRIIPYRWDDRLYLSQK